MNAEQQHRTHVAPAGAALLSLANLPLATRLAAGAAYGIAAGLLLHDDVRVAAITMIVIWIATVWRPGPVHGHGYRRRDQ